MSASKSTNSWGSSPPYSTPNTSLGSAEAHDGHSYIGSTDIPMLPNQTPGAGPSNALNAEEARVHAEYAAREAALLNEAGETPAQAIASEFRRNNPPPPPSHPPLTQQLASTVLGPPISSLIAGATGGAGSSSTGPGTSTWEKPLNRSKERVNEDGGAGSSKKKGNGSEGPDEGAGPSKGKGKGRE